MREDAHGRSGPKARRSDVQPEIAAAFRTNPARRLEEVATIKLRVCGAVIISR